MDKLKALLDLVVGDPDTVIFCAPNPALFGPTLVVPRTRTDCGVLRCSGDTYSVGTIEFTLDQVEDVCVARGFSDDGEKFFYTNTEIQLNVP